MNTTAVEALVIVVQLRLIIAAAAEGADMIDPDLEATLLVSNIPYLFSSFLGTSTQRKRFQLKFV